jgi:hypothetical protein
MPITVTIPTAIGGVDGVGGEVTLPVTITTHTTLITTRTIVHTTGITVRIHILPARIHIRMATATEITAIINNIS